MMKHTVIWIALLCCLVGFYSELNGQIFLQAEAYSNMQGVETQNTSDEGGGLNVGWIDNNDWMEYILDIPIEGDYQMNLRVASLNGGGTLNVSSGANLLGVIEIGSTSGWQNWATIESPVMSFEQGNQTLKLLAANGGFNLNWFEIKLIDPVDTDLPTTPEIVSSSTDEHSILLNWVASFDTTTTITGYKIVESDLFYAFTTDTSVLLTKLPPDTEYNLSVYACDLAGNLSSPSQLLVSTDPIGWELVWFDEFEGTEVDLTKWNFETGGHGWGNGEEQYYTNGSNSSVSDGMLIIEARKETIGSNDFTSSRMNNAEKGDFLYGRIEVRAKLPSTGGTWPAIWTLPTDWVYGGWPDCGEIDIMEHTGNNLGYVFGTIHTGAYNHSIGTQQGGGIVLPDVVNTFHTYTLEWYPDHLDWYYDDQIIFTFENEYNTYAEWPFDVEHHLMLNIAVGGGLGGQINYNGVWPQRMYIDYVRMYDFDLGAGDTIPPSVPPYFQAEVSGITVELSWARSTDNTYVDKYYIFKNDALIDSTSGAQYLVTSLLPLTEYKFGLQAKDFGGNFSNVVNIYATTSDIVSIPVPGKFEAEDYLYMEGMEAETCTDIGGGLNLGYIDEGDWLEYSIDVESTGKYYLTTRTAAQALQGSFQLLDESQNVLTTIETPATGGWQVWKTVVSEGFELSAGIQRIQMLSLAKDFNLNWFGLSTDSTQYISSVNAKLGSHYRIYPNPLYGSDLTIELPVRSSTTGVIIYTIAGQQMFDYQFSAQTDKISLKGLDLKAGVYLIEIKQDDLTVTNKLLVR